MIAKSPRLSCKFFAINQVSVPMLLEMHTIFNNYYENADLDTFILDMSKKSGVFVLKDLTNKRIVGFSTWTEMPITYKGEQAIGVFSGDTIVEEAYWGNKAMHTAFALQAVKTKLKNRGAKVFWLLISKGYKTFLLMTNNVPVHYPSINPDNQRNADLKEVVDTYCKALYPYAYDEKNQLLDFGDNYHALKSHVATISPSMRAENRNIQLFERLNPTWQRGTELPCVAEISLDCIVFFFKKLMFGRRKVRAEKFGKSLA
ncbi:MAG: hypothetical protein KBT77_09500 [Thalassolituus oleivorans]|uniref:Uncharacterized protein n=1 Tax=hydrothermal vent metagenome TaxID=652676 RepID=A0A160TCC5_9ZZZZ|nr:hypothetical protein [Thalassolituus oleivorans]MBQ0727569.1 hypothetical protein [Thalassolituus oleivorans]MBQ0781974.1 hypothetical protein [Thalassolituus oleivorans]